MCQIFVSKVDGGGGGAQSSVQLFSFKASKVNNNYSNHNHNINNNNNNNDDDDFISAFHKRLILFFLKYRYKVYTVSIDILTVYTLAKPLVIQLKTYKCFFSGERFLESTDSFQFESSTRCFT